jgi:hypothetical protein
MLLCRFYDNLAVFIFLYMLHYKSYKNFINFAGNNHI